MFRKIFLISLLGISLVALSETQAIAGVCIAKVGGKCVLWSGSVECGIAATGLGKCIDQTLGCTISGAGLWAVACGNPGTNSWTSPGIQIVYFEGTISGELPVTPDLCDRNGNAFVTVYAVPDQTLLDQLDAGGACPNPNWVSRDAVPCVMNVIDQEMDACGNVVSDAYFYCTLPNCETLGWDKNAQKFERRKYDCVRMDTHQYSYKCP